MSARNDVKLRWDGHCNGTQGQKKMLKNSNPNRVILVGLKTTMKRAGYPDGVSYTDIRLRPKEDKKVGCQFEGRTSNPARFSYAINTARYV